MKNYIVFFCFLFLFACEKDSSVEVQEKNIAQSIQEAEEIEWDDLIPDEYSPNAIILKYKEEIDSLRDDSSQAEIIYQKIIDEMAVAPLNKKLANKQIKLPGFIAPLTQNNGKISEFLLVPYFGACIHVPAPPANQTILVKTAPGQEISIDDADQPIQISGKLTLDKTTTEIGEAGYQINSAIVEAYTEEDS